MAYHTRLGMELRSRAPSVQYCKWNRQAKYDSHWWTFVIFDLQSFALTIIYIHVNDIFFPVRGPLYVSVRTDWFSIRCLFLIRILLRLGRSIFRHKRQMFCEFFCLFCRADILSLYFTYERDSSYKLSGKPLARNLRLNRLMLSLNAVYEN